MKKNEKTMSSLENQKQSLTNVKGGQQILSHDEYEREMTQRGLVVEDIKPEPGRPVSPTAASKSRISVKTAE